jgi:hypothetical protein
MNMDKDFAETLAKANKDTYENQKEQRESMAEAVRRIARANL